MLKNITIALLSICMFLPHLTVSAKSNEKSIETLENSTIKNDAERLYKKINDFLLEHKDISPEQFDDVCMNYIAKNNTVVNLLNKNDFDEKSKCSIVLYRGFSEKHPADNFKKCKVYLSSNTKNVRGMGIYTTTSFECAKRYSDKTNPGTVVSMLIPKTGTKVLENEYLKKLKEMIQRIHPDEFGLFSEDNKENYIFDSMSEFINKRTKIFEEKIKKEKIENFDEQLRILKELCEELEKDPVYQELKANRKRYFKSNKASIFYNSGLLAKLLGFDALHSIDYLSDEVAYKEEEYLIVNPKIIYILNN